ncbi:CLUMA_CG019829, isoform A [Clunio marinus]|uniref:CLUMA_CG019829, isoform A n=1 Tax=Clunio marinus TaxID=568069 RepID=A0A1J1J6U5_9DIPT|nr:CLUMA_CG019829, isoform A [Clunio marinus]
MNDPLVIILFLGTCYGLMEKSYVVISNKNSSEIALEAIGRKTLTHLGIDSVPNSRYCLLSSGIHLMLLFLWVRSNEIYFWKALALELNIKNIKTKFIELMCQYSKALTSRELLNII